MIPLAARRHRTGADGECGSTLLLVLVFLTSVGVLGSALLSYELTLNKLSFSVRRMQTREAGANTGLEWAINSLRQGKDGFCLGGYDRDLLSVGAREVEVECRPDDEAKASRNNVALYLNRSEPAELNVVRTTGDLGTGHAISGPVYNGRGKDGWEIKAPLVVDGDVLLGDDGTCEPGATADMPENVTGSYTNSRRCSTDLSAVTPTAVPQPCVDPGACADPEPILLDMKGGETKTAPACKVFFPGYYTKAPELAGNNYFVSGTYHFELDGEWKIASALRGGDPGPASDIAEADQVLSSAPRCEGAPDPVEPWGVSFVFGRSASMRVLDGARVELFAYSTKDQRLPNLLTGGQKVATEWASPSDLRLDTNLLAVGGGSPEFLLHSGIFAPDSAVSLAGSMSARETINDTVVVGRLEMAGEGGDPPKDASESAGNIGILVPSGAARKYVLVARSCPGGRDVITRDACTNPPAGPLEQDVCAVASATVYDDDRRTVYVDAWRVDRDPSAADPASCAIS